MLPASTWKFALPAKVADLILFRTGYRTQLPTLAGLLQEDGKTTAAYQQDLHACQTLSSKRQFINGEVKSEALLGATVGALAGALEDGADGLIAGAVAGTLIGGADRAWEVRDERQSIIVRCLQNRGHNVVG